MLGLIENNILNYDFDLVASDPSDANTNSATFFSDDTDDKSKRSNNPEAGISIQQEQAEISIQQEEASIATAAAVIEEHPYVHVSEYQPDVPGISDRRRTGSSAPHPPCNRVTNSSFDGPKKSELRIGESSAFFTYVKATTMKRNLEEIAHLDNSGTLLVRVEDMNQACSQQGGNDLIRHENGETIESHSQDDLPRSNSIPDSFSVERSCTPPASMEVSQQNSNHKEKHPQGVVHPRNGSYGSELNQSGMPAQHAYPYYMPGVANHVMMQSATHMYQKNIQNLQSHVSSSMISQYNQLPQCPPHATGMAPYPYFPMSICLQTGQVSTVHPWPSLGSSTSCEANLRKVDRREAALMKFRQKRKERCFDKKIRYVNRKQLAERRPRVRGQFVRKLNGINVDLNGQPASTDYDDEDEEEEENNDTRDSSPKDA